MSHFSAAAEVSAHLQIDFVFTKLHRNLRLRLVRSEITDFNVLITKCREMECAWRENSVMTPVLPVIPSQHYTPIAHT